MIFINLPTEINFPLQSTLRSTITNISNDSIVSGQQTKVVDYLIRSALRQKYSTINKTSNLDKLAKNKWIKIGLNLIKKGVDLNFHITSDVSAISSEAIDFDGFSLPSGGFSEIDDFDDFFDELPSVDGDFDD